MEEEDEKVEEEENICKAEVGEEVEVEVEDEEEEEEWEEEVAEEE